MGNSVRDKHVPFVRFALIYIESGTKIVRAYHLYGKPGNSGENSNGTVHSGGMFSGKR